MLLKTSQFNELFSNTTIIFLLALLAEMKVAPLIIIVLLCPTTRLSPSRALIVISDRAPPQRSYFTFHQQAAPAGSTFAMEMCAKGKWKEME